MCGALGGRSSVAAGGTGRAARAEVACSSRGGGGRSARTRPPQSMRPGAGTGHETARRPGTPRPGARRGLGAALRTTPQCLLRGRVSCSHLMTRRRRERTAIKGSLVALLNALLHLYVHMSTFYERRGEKSFSLGHYNQYRRCSGPGRDAALGAS
ncbi:hypothetical protein EVAR_9047_1 [Eumeta japonica]|uniref:Uncharacterized protein n=1 Tax=Eumeta variegata TaxID=151549 RepID=A0A4C1TVY1_EUMVA|nr:hypothetical protein EVAR_9047_1 [Eumeta japonica]